jgi:hypothetical protein
MPVLLEKRGAGWATSKWRWPRRGGSSARLVAFKCREQEVVELSVALDNGAYRRGKSIVSHFLRILSW